MTAEPGSIVEVGEGRTVRCERCGREIDLCAFCQDPSCPHVICYRCVRTVLRESLDLPHTHGG